MQSGITSQRFNNRTPTTSILTRRKMISRLTFAKNFCQIIGWDQPSVVGARPYGLESSQMRGFITSYSDFFFTSLEIFFKIIKLYESKGLGERSISRKNTILLPLFLPLVAWPFINFVSVQLSMITGKASIIILVVSHSLIYSSATKSESAQQQQAMLFTFCAWLLAKCWHGGSSSSEEGERVKP